MVCIHCGKESPDGADACAFCGMPLNKADSDTSAPPSSSGNEETTPSEIQSAASPFPSGNNPADLPNVKGWSWPAFFLSWLWCFGNRLWLLGIFMLVVKMFSIMYFILIDKNMPYYIATMILKLSLWIYVSINGKELAWIARPFNNTEKFVKTQAIWNSWTSVWVVLFYGFLIVGTAFIPGGNLRSVPRAQFSQCLETLNGLKVAEEMYITDHNIYTPNINELAMYMVPGCDDPKGIAAPCDNLAKRIDDKKTGNCRNGTVSITLSANELSYQIKGASLDHSNKRTGCGICVTPNGYTPEKFASCEDHPHPAMDCP